MPFAARPAPPSASNRLPPRAVPSHLASPAGLPYHAVNVLADPAIREGIKAFSDWPTIPQLYVKGEFVGGCDIVSDMHEDGSLADSLKATE